MDLGIRGRKALVCGGSAGLGKATALALAREGVDLFVAARGQMRLFDACETLAAAGVQVTPIVADHSTRSGRAEILQACPDPDIFIGTISPPRIVESHSDIRPDEWRQALEAGMLSPILLIEAVLPAMIERGWGRILNIATGAAKFPDQSRMLSGAPRAALVNYSVALSRVVAIHNITVNTLLPVMHDTAGIRGLLPAMLAASDIALPPDEVSVDAQIAALVDRLGIPAGRFGNASDFGQVAAMFCSEFANYVTGQSLIVGGGQTNSLF